jgi:hypothetical protein
LDQVDAAKWGTYAGEISEGNGRAMFEDLLQQKKQEVMDDLYN